MAEGAQKGGKSRAMPLRLVWLQRGEVEKHHCFSLLTFGWVFCRS